MDETKKLDVEEVEVVEEKEENEELENDYEDENEKEKEIPYGKKLVNRSTFIFTVRDICEMAILCGLAVVFDMFVKIEIGITGGSLNIAMLPLFIIALRQGWFKGFIAGGIIFGLITCAIDGYGFQTYPLEYFLGFGSVALLGLLKPLITDEEYNVTWHSYAYSTVGMLAAYVLRFFCGTLDSMIIWGYDFIGAVIYNAQYVFPSFIAVCSLFLGLLINVLKAFRAHNTKSL